MSRPRSDRLKDNRIMVAVSLLGLDENGRVRTQSEVSEALAMGRSTVNACVCELISGGFIVEVGKSRRDKLYAKGPRWALLDSQITDEIRDKMRLRRSVQRTRPPASRRDQSEAPEDVDSASQGLNPENGANPPQIAWEVHRPGGGYMFGVEREGVIDKVPLKVSDPSTGRERTVMQSLFSQPSYEVDGGVCWSDRFVLPGNSKANRFAIRYHRTASKKLFYVIPDFEVLVSSDEARSKEALTRAFVRACAPMLMWLERYAGWTFLKDDRGVYVLLSDIRVTQIHRAMRGELNTLITDLTDGAFVGNGEVWTDCSPGSPEFETNSVDYVDAIVALPETRAKADFACREIPVLKADLASIRRDVEELTDISRRLYDVSLTLVRTEANTLRVITSGQTTFDRFVPDGVVGEPDEPAGTENDPPRGYQ